MQYVLPLNEGLCNEHDNIVAINLHFNVLPLIFDCVSKHHQLVYLISPL